jgi:hypothetical protein
MLWTLGFRTSYFEVVTFEQIMVIQNTVKKEQAVQGEWGREVGFVIMSENIRSCSKCTL